MNTATPSLVVVTGGGSGMGRAIALDQVALGNPVVVVGRRQEQLRETASLAENPALVEIAVADLSTSAGTRSVLEVVDGRPVDGIVAAAGGQGDFIRGGASPEAVERAWANALSKNFTSALLVTEALAPSMPAGRGRIVLIGSTAGLDGYGGPYATAKAALQGYARDLARRVGPNGTTVNTLAPGFVGDTDFFAAGGFGDRSDDMVQNAAAQTLVGRIGTPRDVAACVRWLLSEDAGWITGQVITINGGSVLVR